LPLCPLIAIGNKVYFFKQNNMINISLVGKNVTLVVIFSQNLIFKYLLLKSFAYQNLLDNCSMQS
jgi:hypothetical protein